MNDLARCQWCSQYIEYFPDDLGLQHFRIISGSPSDPVFVADPFETDHKPVLLDAWNRDPQ